RGRARGSVRAGPRPSLRPLLDAPRCLRAGRGAAVAGSVHAGEDLHAARPLACVPRTTASKAPRPARTVNQGLAVATDGLRGPDRCAAERAFHGGACDVL